MRSGKASARHPKTESTHSPRSHTWGAFILRPDDEADFIDLLPLLSKDNGVSAGEAFSGALQGEHASIGTL
jgi:hypothetical protein